jgi:NCS1 family nucleobase:cation symporter-1
MFGFDNLVAWFIIFQLLQIGLSVLGFQGIKWLENIGAVFILFSLFYMFFSVINRYGAEITANLVNIEGTWGLPFWGATMLFLGIYSTMILNVSDYAREHTHGSSPSLLVTIYSMSILPVTLFMGLIGLMVSGATGVTDPIQVFANAVDNKPLLIVTLLFIAFAQVTTNVLNNVIPPTYVLMDIFKLPFKLSTVIVGFLAFATFPWELVKDESAAGLQIFVQTYSAFLGPIFAVMVVDYYLLRKRTLDVGKLYDETGPYSGVNWAAIIASLIGAVVALTFSAVSWYASLIPAGVIYWLLMQYWGPAQRFRA